MSPLDADRMLVELAGFRVYGVDEYGARWKTLGLDGWDGAPVRVDLQERPGENGAFPPEPLYGARDMTLQGGVETRGPQARRLAETRVRALISRLTGVLLHVKEPPYDRQAVVWLNGRPTFTPTGPGRLRFSIPLVAPDYVRYGTVERSTPISLPSSPSGFSYPYTYPYDYGGGSSGDRTIVNDGDAAVWPILRIDGPVDNPSIRNDTTGDALELDISLAEGDWLHIDPSDESVLLGGTASRRGVVTGGSRWPYLPRGESRWQFRADSYSAATLTVIYRSGWT